MTEKISYTPIGTIYTPFEKRDGIPIQPAAGKGIKGTIVLKEEFTEGLKDLDGFSHIFLVYCFHLSRDYSLKVIPYMDTKERGVFATRAPRRPNNIGISIVKLIKIEGNVLHIEDIDIVNGTPLLDIKPFSPRFNNREAKNSGWLKDRQDNVDTKKSNGRFI